MKQKADKRERELGEFNAKVGEGSKEDMFKELLELDKKVKAK